MSAAWANVLRISKLIQNLRGEFRWNGEAAAFYDEWYQKHVIKQDPALVGYYDSKQILVIKVAMLFALSERQELVLRRDDIEYAMDLLEITEKNMLRVFEGVGRNELAMVQAVFMETIVRSGGIISYATLRRDTFSLCDEQEFAEVIKYLCDTGQWKTAVKGSDSFFLTAAESARRKLGERPTGKQPPDGTGGSPAVSPPSSD